MGGLDVDLVISCIFLSLSYDLNGAVVVTSVPVVSGNPLGVIICFLSSFVVTFVLFWYFMHLACMLTDLSLITRVQLVFISPVVEMDRRLVLILPFGPISMGNFQLVLGIIIPFP